MIDIQIIAWTIVHWVDWLHKFLHSNIPVLINCPRIPMYQRLNPITGWKIDTWDCIVIVFFSIRTCWKWKRIEPTSTDHWRRFHRWFEIINVTTNWLSSLAAAHGVDVYWATSHNQSVSTSHMTHAYIRKRTRESWTKERTTKRR